MVDVYQTHPEQYDDDGYGDADYNHLCILAEHFWKNGRSMDDW
jgi:hypothetical protein